MPHRVEITQVFVHASVGGHPVRVSDVPVDTHTEFLHGVLELGGGSAVTWSNLHSAQGSQGPARGGRREGVTA